jgi:hypothetical protein
VADIGARLPAIIDGMDPIKPGEVLKEKSALAARNRASEIDAAYVAYDEFPIDEPDEWGSLAAFCAGVAPS